MPITPPAALEEFRDAFYARLRRNRLQLATLSAQLACADRDSARVFDAIQLFAHQLGGAATLFGVGEIGSVADALERAANSALAQHAVNGDAAVWRSLVALADRLAIVDRKARGGGTP